jgi:hypothetical protein
MVELIKAVIGLIVALIVTSFKGAILVFAFIGFKNFLKTKLSRR